MEVLINKTGGDSGGGGVNRLPCSCSCRCPFCGLGPQPSSPSPRALKRKLEQMDEDAQIGRLTDVARVEIDIEAAALREALASQQQSIQGLYSELEEERSAASSAASEAMSMILRLQREKAEAQMDARQFKRLADEKMSHDQQEIALLEDLLFKRDQAVQSLTYELQTYRHRLLSYGIDPNEPDSPTAEAALFAIGGGSNAYTPIRGELADSPENAPDPDLKYAAGDAPRSPMEKGVIGNGYAPCWAQRTLRKLSIDSFSCPSFRQEFSSNEFPSMMDQASDTRAIGRDDMNDRVYTIDAVHSVNEVYDDAGMPGESLGWRDEGTGSMNEGELRRLNTRLQALEADRESMRRAIMTMGTDRSQRLLLKGIARQLCKEVVPERRPVQKPSFLRSFSILSLFKWVASLIIWRKKAPKIKYPFGISNQMTGLLILLDKSQRKRLKRCPTRMPRLL